MKIFIAILFAILSFSFSSSAQMGIGGGCMVEGQLCEQEDALHLEPLEVEGLILKVGFLRSELLGFPQLTENISKTRKWFLDDRKFNPYYCSPQGLSEAPQDISIVACQSPIEVRISKQFWANATEEQKLSLILHELMMTYFLDQKKEAALARHATQLLLDTNKSVYQIRPLLLKLGLPMMNTVRERQVFVEFILVNKADICAGEIQSVNQSMDDYFLKNWEMIAYFHKDYKFFFISGLQKVLNLVDQNSKYCHSDKLLLTLSESVFDQNGYQ